MKNERFVEFVASVRQALEHVEGKRRLRATTFPLSPRPLTGRAVKRVRVATRSRAGSSGAKIPPCPSPRGEMPDRASCRHGGIRSPEGAARIRTGGLEFFCNYK